MHKNQLKGKLCSCVGPQESSDAYMCTYSQENINKDCYQNSAHVKDFTGSSQQRIILDG